MGSRAVCASPILSLLDRVLRRLVVPRHPPTAHHVLPGHGSLGRRRLPAHAAFGSAHSRRSGTLPGRCTCSEWQRLGTKTSKNISHTYAVVKVPRSGNAKTLPPDVCIVRGRFLGSEPPPWCG